MKSLLAFLIIFLTFYFFAPGKARAQFFAVPQPGLNCGTLEESNNLNMCCTFKPSTVALPQSLGVPGGEIVITAVRGVIDQVVQPFINNLTNAAGETIQPCLEGVPSTPDDPSNIGCRCVKPNADALNSLTPLCDGLSSTDPNSANEKGMCTSCNARGGVWTAAGCIYVNPKDFLEKTVLGWGIGIAGSIGLLCIIYAAFMIQTSQGNAEKTKKARELLTSCISGLLLIIFSVFILRIIGVDILGIPFISGS